LSYRIIGLGFPFLTIGIISGAVWANEAWGAYWSWDPRNVGIDHMVSVSIYLHSRLLKGWQGQKPLL
jgi:ABC-type transport system involved in cytochrome c biogenesis permease subunit